MTIQQRMQILQILYGGRTYGSQTLDRDILVQSMAIGWETIRQEVAYLEENGYIELKRRQMDSRIFEALRITAKGIDLIESSLVINAPQSHIDVLLVTVTDIEAGTVLKAFPEAKLCHLGDQAYHDLGMMRDAKIFMVQSEMGSGGQSGAILTIQEAIDTLHPSAVIMVGVAFGMDKKKRQLGDILISKQIQPYDLQKIGTDHRGKMAITLRGDRPSSSPRMLSIFRGAANYWQTPPKIHFGLLLSGDKVIANQAFRDQLASLGPEAIGGEMEGAGLYAAAQRKKVDWILVKAVCDWADGGKNDAYQQLAAENAVRFLVHVLEKGGFAASRVGGFQPNVVDNSSHINVIKQTEPNGSSLPENIEKTSSVFSTVLQHKIDTEDFDVFLCYNLEDRIKVKKIAENLKEQGILPWFDEWQLRPGFPWQRSLETQIKKIKSAAIFVGKAGLGPWHQMETEAFIRQFVQRNCPVIPVLLIDAPQQPDLPVFLEGMEWVDFHLNEPDPLKRLIWGITGRSSS